MDHKKARGAWMVTVQKQGGKVPHQTCQLSHQMKAKEGRTVPKCSHDGERREWHGFLSLLLSPDGCCR